MESISDDLEVDIEQVSAVGTDWGVHTARKSFAYVWQSWPPFDNNLHHRKATLPPRQVCKDFFQVSHHVTGFSDEIGRVVTERISDFLLGKAQNLKTEFPSSSLQCSHHGEVCHPSKS
jgi:hypothetical protein